VKAMETKAVAAAFLIAIYFLFWFDGKLWA
jgi:hypothetical protein